MKRLFKIIIRLIAAVATNALLTSAALAGQHCEEKAATPEAIRNGLNMAQKTQAALDTTDAKVVILARNGQDLRQYKLKYSHAAFAIRKDAEWLIFHLLNNCGQDTSGIFEEGLGAFFMDNPFRYEALILVPKPELQAKLASILASEAPKQLKATRYNMLAYPFNDASQNSNQWLLELLTIAMSSDQSISTRAEAHEFLQYVKYKPSVIYLSTLTRLGAGITKQNISFNDHPFDKRMAGQIETVTVDSIARFLKLRGIVNQIEVEL